VHGTRGEDPTDPPSSGPYPAAAVSHEPRIQHLAEGLPAERPQAVPRAARHHAPRGRARAEQVHPVRVVRRLPVPRPGPRRIRTSSASSRPSSGPTSRCGRTRRSGACSPTRAAGA
jgi:hypothetical protein